MRKIYYLCAKLKRKIETQFVNIQKYNLPTASSVKRAIDFLNDYEYIYPSEDGYMVYDRFFGLWLQRQF